MEILPDLSDNLLLHSFNETELQWLIPDLDLINVSHAEVLFDDNEELHYLYFPTTAIISLLNCLEDGSAVELAMVGREGLLGVRELFGENISKMKALVIQEGSAYRISLASLKSHIARNQDYQQEKLLKVLLRYLKMLVVQMCQSSGCNRRHTIRQKLSSWLLLAFDRTENNLLSVTHSTISYCLGVRRESVSVAAMSLQDSGLIKYNRGKMELMDRVELENMTCECYKVIKDASRKLTSDLPIDLSSY